MHDFELDDFSTPCVGYGYKNLFKIEVGCKKSKNKVVSENLKRLGDIGFLMQHETYENGEYNNYVFYTLREEENGSFFRANLKMI